MSDFGPVWRKSSYSGSEGGQCVEVALHLPLTVIRDSKNPDGDVLSFDRAGWHSFLGHIKAGSRQAV